MFDLILIPHKEVTSNQLKDIIKIKSKAWPYSFERQLEWINANLKEADIHVLLSLNETDVAYLNLIDIALKLDGIVNEGYGIGNVCASEKGKGWGKEVMTQTNLYLKLKNKIGLLFCKNSLVKFYSLNSWKLIEKKEITLSFDNKSFETMIFNCDKEFHNLEYSGKPF
jgi:hypothetical protein